MIDVQKVVEPGIDDDGSGHTNEKKDTAQHDIALTDVQLLQPGGLGTGEMSGGKRVGDSRATLWAAILDVYGAEIVAAVPTK